VKIIHSDPIGALLAFSLKKVRASDGDLHDYLSECVGEIAKWWTCMADDEAGGVDAVDLWDEKHEGFEAGVKVGAALGDRDLVLSGFVSDDEVGDPDVVLGGQWMFWFVARDEKAVLEELGEETRKWVAKVRQENGLLPFDE
jgi:hypothetical protein